MARVLGSLPPYRETQMQLQIPAFCLTQPWFYFWGGEVAGVGRRWAFESEPEDESSLCVSLFSNKNKHINFLKIYFGFFLSNMMEYFRKIVESGNKRCSATKKMLQSMCSSFHNLYFPQLFFLKITHQ